MEAASDKLVIFDCDGVLVDSEPLSIVVLCEALAARGVTLTADEAYDRFLGKSLKTMTDILHEEFGLAIDEVFLDDMRLDLYGRFREKLLPIEGIAETLDQLTLRRCVASSSQPERIRLSLTVTGLIDRLEPNIFSATMVSRGKPAPDLFLHAAREMQAEPKNCIVIEDSSAGIMAAKAAGMTVFAYIGGSHAQLPGYREKIEALEPHVVFDAMPDLIHLVQKF